VKLVVATFLLSMIGALLMFPLSKIFSFSGCDWAFSVPSYVHAVGK
jgi:hypothetical protein